MTLNPNRRKWPNYLLLSDATSLLSSFSGRVIQKCVFPCTPFAEEGMLKYASTLGEAVYVYLYGLPAIFIFDDGRTLLVRYDNFQTSLAVRESMWTDDKSFLRQLERDDGRDFETLVDLSETVPLASRTLEEFAAYQLPINYFRSRRSQDLPNECILSIRVAGQDDVLLTCTERVGTAGDFRFASWSDIPQEVIDDLSRI